MAIYQIKSSWRKLSAVAVLFLGMSFQQAFAHAHLKDQLPAEGAAVERLLNQSPLISLKVLRLILQK